MKSKKIIKYIIAHVQVPIAVYDDRSFEYLKNQCYTEFVETDQIDKTQNQKTLEDKIESLFFERENQLKKESNTKSEESNTESEESNTKSEESNTKSEESNTKSEESKTQPEESKTESESPVSATVSKTEIEKFNKSISKNQSFKCRRSQLSEKDKDNKKLKYSLKHRPR